MSKLRLNLCCGANYREGYINIDFVDIDSSGKPIKVDLVCDLLEGGLPCNLYNNNVDEIIFHESLEHFNRWNGIRVLDQIYLALKPGGKLSLTVPNATRQLKILLARMNDCPTKEDFYNAHKKITFWKWHDDLMGGTNYSDGSDGNSHKTLYSVNSLKCILEFVGFKVEKLTIDSSIRVEAIK